MNCVGLNVVFFFFIFERLWVFRIEVFLWLNFMILSEILGCKVIFLNSKISFCIIIICFLVF